SARRTSGGSSATAPESSCSMILARSRSCRLTLEGSAAAGTERGGGAISTGRTASKRRPKVLIGGAASSRTSIYCSRGPQRHQRPPARAAQSPCETVRIRPRQAYLSLLLCRAASLVQEFV